jgi:hypothetical protein
MLLFLLQGRQQPLSMQEQVGWDVVDLDEFAYLLNLEAWHLIGCPPTTMAISSHEL